DEGRADRLPGGARELALRLLAAARAGPAREREAAARLRGERDRLTGRDGLRADLVLSLRARAGAAGAVHGAGPADRDREARRRLSAGGAERRGDALDVRHRHG